MEAMEAMEGGVAGRANTVIALLECGVVASCDADAQDTRACDADHASRGHEHEVEWRTEREV